MKRNIIHLIPVPMLLLLISCAFIANCLAQSDESMDAQIARCGQGTVDVFGPKQAAKARAFFVKLREAVKANDKQKIAGMINYPLHLYRDNKPETIQNRSSFLKKYQALFTSQITDAIANQTPECLFGNWQGVMIGRGNIWYEDAGHGYKIITINQ